MLHTREAFRAAGRCFQVPERDPAASGMAAETGAEAEAAGRGPRGP